MNPTDQQIERTIERLHVTTRAETDRHILDDAFAAFEKSAQVHLPHIGRSARRRILRIRIAELAAVAAVILVVFALLFGTRATKTVGLGEIYEALGKVENICIATFLPSANEPVRVEWVSQTLNINMLRFGEQFVLLDIPNKVRMIKFLSTGSVTTTAITDQMLTKFEEASIQRFGLVPFSDISDVSGAEWICVQEPEIEAAVSGAKVYELTWPGKNSTSEALGLKRWRVFIDRRTKLPKRTEHYFRLEPGEDYKFEKYEVITYPSESEIQAVIQKTFGPAASRPGEPEYMGTPQPD